MLVDSSRSPSRQRRQIGAAALLQHAQLGQRLVQILTLLLQGAPAPVDVGDQELQLATFAGLLVVEVEDVRDLGEGEAEPFAAQDELQPDPFAIMEDPGGADPLRRQQAAVLVEPDGAQRGVELGRQLADAPGALRHEQQSRAYVDVNVRLC